MKIKKHFKYEDEIQLDFGASEFKKRLSSLNIETSIFRTSLKKRQLGLLLKKIEFKNDTEFNILKIGDTFYALKSGSGIIKGHIIENKDGGSTLKVSIKSNFNELGITLIPIIMLLMITFFFPYDIKLLLAAGMTGVLILALGTSLWSMKRSLRRLRAEFYEIIEMIK